MSRPDHSPGLIISLLTCSCSVSTCFSNTLQIELPSACFKPRLFKGYPLRSHTLLTHTLSRYQLECCLYSEPFSNHQFKLDTANSTYCSDFYIFIIFISLKQDTHSNYCFKLLLTLKSN